MIPTTASCVPGSSYHSGTEGVSHLPQVTQLQSLLRAPPSVASLNLEDPLTFSEFSCVRCRIRRQESFGVGAGEVGTGFKVYSPDCCLS